MYIALIAILGAFGFLALIRPKAKAEPAQPVEVGENRISAVPPLPAIKPQTPATTNQVVDQTKKWIEQTEKKGNTVLAKQDLIAYMAGKKSAQDMLNAYKREADKINAVIPARTALEQYYAGQITYDQYLKAYYAALKTETPPPAGTTNQNPLLTDAVDPVKDQTLDQVISDYGNVDKGLVSTPTNPGAMLDDVQAAIDAGFRNPDLTSTLPAQGLDPGDVERIIEGDQLPPELEDWLAQDVANPTPAIDETEGPISWLDGDSLVEEAAAAQFTAGLPAPNQQFRAGFSSGGGSGGGGGED